MSRPTAILIWTAAVVIITAIIAGASPATRREFARLSWRARLLFFAYVWAGQLAYAAIKGALR